MLKKRMMLWMFDDAFRFFFFNFFSESKVPFVAILAVSVFRYSLTLFVRTTVLVQNFPTAFFLCGNFKAVWTSFVQISGRFSFFCVRVQ